MPEIEGVLHVIQTFDPAGIAARDLQECLLLQLERRPSDEAVEHAEQILNDTFEEFTKKHYQRIQQKLDLEEDELKEAIGLILKLNPKPGGSGPVGPGKIQYIIPDFLLSHDNGQFNLTLNTRNAPDLRVSPAYTEMFRAYDKASKKDKKMKEAVTFVKQKLDSAKWFIDAIRQRQNTLLRTMDAIVRYQREFFEEGDESKLRPMILKDIAQEISMDISTVSRVANSKAVQTEFGIYPLKYFFSEGIATDSGEDASSREVKHILKEIIEGEQKKKAPLRRQAGEDAQRPRLQHCPPHGGQIPRAAQHSGGPPAQGALRLRTVPTQSGLGFCLSPICVGRVALRGVEAAVGRAGAGVRRSAGRPAIRAGQRGRRFRQDARFHTPCPPRSCSCPCFVRCLPFRFLRCCWRGSGGRWCCERLPPPARRQLERAPEPGGWKITPPAPLPRCLSGASPACPPEPARPNGRPDVPSSGSAFIPRPLVPIFGDGTLGGVSSAAGAVLLVLMWCATSCRAWWCSQPCPSGGWCWPW